MRKRIFVVIMICLAGTGVSFSQYKTQYTVAQDGTGDYRTLKEVLNVCKSFPDQRIEIRLKPGVYKEKIEIFSWTTRIALLGENADSTIITFDDHTGKGDIMTFTSYTVKVMGDDFYAENITFENAAGPVGQAVALHVEADRCIFRRCKFKGNQDTIYAAGAGSRQYFIDCYIDGTTDFIFGAATAVFENCEIRSKRNSFVTAASTPQDQPFGYVFMHCRLTADAGVDKVFLGRPWRNYARTVFIECTLGSHIIPEGWQNWGRKEAESKTFYAEYKNTGPGAASGSRVAWAHTLTAKEARGYTLQNIFRDWDGKPR